MIVVRVELHSAITGKVEELARMVINKTGGTHTIRDYRARALRGRSRAALDRAWDFQLKPTREGHVYGHSRLALHVWHLVAKALSSMEYGK